MSIKDSQLRVIVLAKTDRMWSLRFTEDERMFFKDTIVECEKSLMHIKRK